MIIGTAGHIDHGKTALIGALTGVDTDRLKEEKARGISIDLGFAYLPTEAGILGFIDVPGHERFIHTMLAGASGIDFALVVVAADDGVMPQTREHLAILDLLGVSHGIVALAKADLADPARRAAVSAGIAAALAGTALEGAPILAVSARTGEGIAELRAALVAAAASFAAERQSGRFRLSVDRSFALSGAGTVVTGTVVSGAVAVGDRVTVSPSGLAARVRSIHAQNRPAERGSAGDRCALNLAGDGVSAQAIARGDVVLDPSLHAPTDRIDASLRVLATETKPLGTWFPARLHHGAVEVGARVVPLDAEALLPGAEGRVQLVLERPIAAAVRDRFVLRDTSARRTIGGGRFIDLRAPARKRRTPERLAVIDAAAEADPVAALAGLVELPPYHLDLDAFARDRALAAEAPAALASALGLVTLAAGGITFALSAARWTALRAEIVDRLAAYHAANPDLAGLGVEKLRMELAVRLPKPAFLVALARLAQEGVLAVEGAWVRLAGHEVRLAERDERLWEVVAPMLAGPERFRPPRVRDIAGRLGEPEADIRRLFKLLSRLGKVDEVAHDHFFLRPVVSAMVGYAEALASGGEFSAAAFRDRIEGEAGTGEHAVGRKVAIQILEFFDRHGVTLRRGDLRRINRHRLDLFGPAERSASDEGAAKITAPSEGRDAEESYLR
ncbi:selenocysteine-specific translation elongation factor [Ancylobacter sonchi]|uniref:selenocysteine-specific translation elongation factor n=1 Tax=Ancylobacter sonchi TaxID=1937790 RepID=UPI001BD53615|nr:selenocysteine-specific translation elongation factor [Ancylobacter sonchi]MBS7535817.1 selenocysteine-specific translation elongation factor [Ancylobacter sonchi]